MVDVLDKGKLELVQFMGSDAMVVHAARVSFGADRDEVMSDERLAGMIRFMMTNKHGSVFEHCVATFYVKAPLMVFREWHRHRTGSYNEESARYSVLKPEFYIPDFIRTQVGKPGAYTFEALEDERDRDVVRSTIENHSLAAYAEYEGMLASGVAKEQARLVLPVNIYSSMYATANLRNWFKFLELRTSEHAMYEIRQYANSIATILGELYPVTYAAWQDNGRIAP